VRSVDRNPLENSSRRGAGRGLCSGDLAGRQSLRPNAVQAVARTSLAKIKGIVPSYRSLLIYYDSNATSFESLRDRVRGMLSWSVLAEIAKMAETGDQAKTLNYADFKGVLREKAGAARQD
jgi:hypothetical protein